MNLISDKSFQQEIIFFPPKKCWTKKYDLEMVENLNNWSSERYTCYLVFNLELVLYVNVDVQIIQFELQKSVSRKSALRWERLDNIKSGNLSKWFGDIVRFD
jgi:hypothetical protein